MSSIFTGVNALRHNYKFLTAAQLAGATNPATAIMLSSMTPTGARFLFLDNRLDKEATMLLVHPEADSAVVANRMLWIDVDTFQVINYSLAASPSLEFDPGTKIFVYCASAPTSGKLKIAWWG